MATIKVVLRKKQHRDGTYPLALRITQNRQASYTNLGHSISIKQWDENEQKVKKSHPNSHRLNNFLLKKKAEAFDTLLNLQTNDPAVSLKNIKEKIKPKIGVSFFSQADIFIENMRKQGKYNRVKPDQSRLNSFKQFLEGKDISFQDITVPLLNKFRVWLKATRNISERSIINTLLIIRTIYNQAIKAGIIDAKNYPFGNGKITIRFPQSIKIGLNTEELKTLEEIPLEGYRNHARNLWLFSFYFAGMRISDILKLKWADFQNERLYYAMGKNAKAGSLKIPAKAVQILNQYKNNRPIHDLVFPELKSLENLTLFSIQRKTAFAVKRLNKTLKEVSRLAGINKPLTMHIARHTFGNLSGDKIPIQMLQKLYRHSSITTTIGYQANFIHKSADEALDAVVSF